MPEQKSTSPWVYVGCGCGILLLACVAVCGSFAYLGFKTAKDLEAQQSDPAAREAAALEALGLETLPEGYRATFTFSIPIFLRMLVLESAEENRGLIYVYTRNNWRHLDAYLSGERDPLSVAQELGAGVRSGAPIGNGEMTLDGMELYYWSRRGNVEFHRVTSSGPTWHVDTDIDPGFDLPDDGLYTLVFVRCDNDLRQRVAIWTAPDPSPESPPEEVDFGGTPADPDRIRSLFSTFGICG